MLVWYDRILANWRRIDSLIDLEVTIDGSEMSDIILKGLERDFRLFDFLFFWLAQDNSDYHRQTMQVYVQTPLLKMKYERKINPTRYI